MTQSGCLQSLGFHQPSSSKPSLLERMQCRSVFARHRKKRGELLWLKLGCNYRLFIYAGVKQEGWRALFRRQNFGGVTQKVGPHSLDRSRYREPRENEGLHLPTPTVAACKAQTNAVSKRRSFYTLVKPGVEMSRSNLGHSVVPADWLESQITLPAPTDDTRTPVYFSFGLLHDSHTSDRSDS